MNKAPTLYMAVGPSGSGKSTVFEKIKLKNLNIHYYSWDALRLEWYDPTDYSNAWHLSNLDKEFKQKHQQYFRDLIETGEDIFVDNTNLTKKRRRFYLEIADKANYRTIGITFDVPLQTLIDRQKTRGDKSVPINNVIQQFNSYQYPTTDEFEKIIGSNEITRFI